MLFLTYSLYSGCNPWLNSTLNQLMLFLYISKYKFCNFENYVVKVTHNKLLLTDPELSPYDLHCLHPFVKPDLSFYQNLALCTAALMYILSRDRLNMDLDRACLELMIKLLELDQDYSGHQDQLTAKEMAKVKEKIRKLCETVHNKHLDLENITVGCPSIKKS